MLAQFTIQSPDRWFNIIGGSFFIICFVISLLLLFDVWKLKRSEEVKLLWTLVLFLIPVIGIVLYVLVGRRASDDGINEMRDSSY